MKKCVKCNKVQLSTFFRKYSNRNCTRLYCKKCENKMNKTRRQENIEKYRKLAREGWKRNGMKYRLKKYNITQEQFDEFIIKQDNKCAICKTDFTEDSIKIDHNHQTGKVRGLLCFTCNIHLGFLERGDIKEKMEKYLLENSD